MTVETPRRRKSAGIQAGGLSLRLLGEIRLQRGGETIALPASKRTRALLGYLVTTAVPQARQTLCDLLWDGPDDPRAALRWSLTKLRQVIDDDSAQRLDADREHVAFRTAGALVDLQRLKDLGVHDPRDFNVDDLEEIAELLAGEFLDGLDLPSCYRFHHWCLAEREKWGAFRRRVLLELAQRLNDQPEKALGYARELVSADPLSEAAHGGLVALLVALGRRADAQEHYSYARNLLKREMGAPLVGVLKPPPPFRRQVELPVDGPPPDAAAQIADEKHNLVGRIQEQVAISAAVDELIAGGSARGLLFLGEPGIGKSRLLTYLASEGGKRGARALSARCFEAEAARPYGCLGDALRPSIEALGHTEQRRNLTLLMPGFGDGEGDDHTPARLFGAVQSLLRDISHSGPLILLIDDLQWIDEASSALLHFLLRESDSARGFLFASAARADEIDENPWCKKLVAALLQGSKIQALRLAALTAAETAQFMGLPAESAEVAVALRESGGNPLFLAEMARAERAGEPNVGQGLAGLIGGRVSRLDSVERELIVYASATIRPFKPELLGAAMDIPEAKLVERLARLEARGLLKPETDGRFDFAHDLFRQATYRGLSHPRRRLIHRQIARAIESAAISDQSLAGELAFHAGAAGDQRLAVRAYIAAGEHCLRLFANSEAIDAADRGLGHLEHWSAGPERVHAQIALLGVKVFAGASPGVRAMPKLLDELHRAVEVAELMDLREDAAHCWHLISWTTQQNNDIDSSRTAILRAEFLSRKADDATRCQHLCMAGRCILEVEGELSRARSFLTDADDLAIRLQQTFVELEWGKGLLARWDGDLDQANLMMRRALTLARLREDRWREMECLIWIAKIAVERRAYQEVAEHCDAIDAVAERIGDRRAPAADALRALAAFLGDRSKAPALRVCLAGLRALDDKAHLAYVLNEFSAAEIEFGSPGAGRAAAEEALNAALTVKRGTEVVVATSLLARARATEGVVDEAAELLSRPINGCGSTPFSARARQYLDRAAMSLGNFNAGSNAGRSRTDGPAQPVL